MSLAVVYQTMISKEIYKLQFVGLTIPQGWRGGDLPIEEENNPAKQYEFSKSIAIAADNLGFHSIYAYDHLIPHYKDDVEKNIFECFTLLSSTAAIQLDESLSVIKAMWTSKKASFEGKYYTIKEAICNPKPIQKPHPTIMIGGWGEKYLLKVVARYADRYNLFFGSPDQMNRKISILKEYCSSIGRDDNEIQYSVVVPCLIGESEDEVYQSLIKHKRKDKVLKQYLQYLVGGITIGTPERIIKGLNEYIGIGVSHFIIHFVELNIQSLKLFESKIISKI